MRCLVLCMIVSLLATFAQAQTMARVKVSENQRFLVTEDGKPFFYLADTAWELFHRLDREQAVQYLTKRASQKYTAIQAVALAELDGVSDPNAYGELPLIDKDPTRPAVTPGANPTNAQAYDYWDHVEYIVDQANARGLYIAMLPSWGRWVNQAAATSAFSRRRMPRRTANSSAGASGRRAIIWILGGDRTPTGFEETWRALAQGHRHRRVRQRRLQRRADELPPAGRAKPFHLVPQRRLAGLQHAPDRPRPGREDARRGRASQPTTSGRR